MSNIKKVMGCSVLGIVGLWFFVILMFPYEVLKESIAVQVHQATGYTLQIKKMTSALPIGLHADSIKISNPGKSNVELKSVTAKIKLLPLLIGNISVSVEIEEKQGYLYVEATNSISQVIQGNAMPKKFSCIAEDFGIDPLAGFFLNSFNHSDSVHVMLKPLLASVQIRGDLTANINLTIDPQNVANTEGGVNVALKKLSFVGNDLPTQNFSVANIQGQVSKGVLSLTSKTEFKSEDLAFGISGTVSQKPEMSMSTLDITMPFELGPGFTDPFGVILNAVIKKDPASQFTVKLAGPISQLSTSID